MAVNPLSGDESVALRLTWSAAPAACTNHVAPNWPGIHHYQVYRRTGSGDNTSCASNTTTFSTTNPAVAAELVQSPASGATAWTNFVHRSAKDFRYLLVACGDASCSIKYGALSPSQATNDQDWDCTLIEKWVVTDVDGMDPDGWATGVYWVAEGANASAALFYPFVGHTSFDSMGLWYSDGDRHRRLMDGPSHGRLG